jgi:predicted PilT family ATPase
MKTDKSGAGPADAGGVPVVELHLIAKPGIKVSEVLSDYPDVKDALFARLDPRCSGGSLVLITGGAGNGKTMTAMAALEDVAQRGCGNGWPMPLAHVGILEHRFSPAIAARTDMGESCQLGNSVPEPMIFYDQFYQQSGRMAFEALAMVMAGRKVIGVIHGNSAQDGVDRLREILVDFGVGASFLTDLINWGQVFSVYQVLKAADAPQGAVGN